MISLVRQDNPGPMTLDGTNTWVLQGAEGAIVIDPGQGEPASHLDAVLDAAGPVALVLVTHGHPDHVELAPELGRLTGAPVRASDPAHCVDAAPLADGEVLSVGDVSLRVLATPGHTSDSVCFVLDERIVFTGDTILGRGTTVVAHPDGALGPYLSSLQALEALGGLEVRPGHGPVLPSVGEVAAQYLTHREQRLEQVRGALHDLGSDASARRIVEVVYADVDQSVWWAAELSVQAQLDYLRT